MTTSKRDSLTAMILCGGLGTRLRSVAGQLPKALVPVAGVPFLEYLFRYLARAGVCDVVLCTGYGAEQVAHQYQDGSPWGLRLRLSPEPEPLGTAGAVKNAEALVDCDPFLVLNGDSLSAADLDRLVRVHSEKRARFTMALVQTPDRDRFGSVLLGKDGAIEGFCEKGQQGQGLINAGIYAVDRSVLAEIPAGRAVSMEREVLPRLVGNGLVGVVMDGPFVDIGTPESHAAAEALLPELLGER